MEKGGISALLEYQKKCNETDLFDSINYSLSKLSTRDENKLSISNYIDHFYNLLHSQNDRSIDFSLQTLLNLSSDSLQFLYYNFTCSNFLQIKEKALQVIKDTNGINAVAEIIQQNQMKDPLLRLALDILLICCSVDRLNLNLLHEMRGVITNEFRGYLQRGQRVQSQIYY